MIMIVRLWYFRIMAVVFQLLLSYSIKAFRFNDIMDGSFLLGKVIRCARLQFLKCSQIFRMNFACILHGFKSLLSDQKHK